MIMKNLFILFSLFFCFNSLLGQDALDQIQQSLQTGDLATAETYVEKALEDPALKKESRTFYLAGFLYKELLLKGSESKKPEYRRKAFDHVKSGISVDDGSLKEQFVQLEQYLLSTLFNEGVETFNSGDYVTSTSLFESFIKENRNTQAEVLNDAYYYAGVGHFIKNNDNKAFEYFLFAESNGYQNPMLYNDLANIYVQKGELNKARESIVKGLSLDPANKELLVTELNILSSMKDYNQASTKISSYLKTYPDDFDALLMAGTIYEKEMELKGSTNESFNKIKEVYKQAIGLNPGDFHANYNYGVTLYNRGVDLITQKDYDVKLSELKAVVAESSALFAEAMPYLEKSKIERPRDVALLKALRGIYYNLDKREKLLNINQELVALGESN
jgi:tetratricopeptide (TPR) repeat protein